MLPFVYFRQKSKFTDHAHIDRAVQAYLPAKYPDLYDLVRTCMIHGPCSVKVDKAKCRQKNPEKCDSKYPKDFSEKTFSNINGYPNYKRPRNGPRDLPLVQPVYFEHGKETEAVRIALNKNSKLMAWFRLNK